MAPHRPDGCRAFAEGSVTNADFRGKAPLANLFSMNNGNSDYALQTNAALIQRADLEQQLGLRQRRRGIRSGGGEL